MPMGSRGRSKSPFFLRVSKRDVEQNGEEMAGAAGDDEQVPEGVKVANPVVVHQKCRSQGVAKAAYEQQPQANWGDAFNQGSGCGDRHPTQGDIDPYRDAMDSVGEENFGVAAQNRNRPHHAEEDRPRNRPQECKRKRRKRAHDQQIDAALVEGAKEVFQLSV